MLVDNNHRLGRDLKIKSNTVSLVLLMGNKRSDDRKNSLKFINKAYPTQVTGYNKHKIITLNQRCNFVEIFLFF